MDLIRYYKDFKIKTLSDALKSGESQKKVLKTAYLLNEQILKEYFENIGSSRILRTLENLISTIQDSWLMVSWNL